MTCKDKNGMYRDSPISYAFGLSYASFLVVPRLLMEGMSYEWQETMVKLMDEFNEKYNYWIPEDKNIVVRMTGKDGRYTKLPENICNYRRGDASAWEKGNGEAV